MSSLQLFLAVPFPSSVRQEVCATVAGPWKGQSGCLSCADEAAVAAEAGVAGGAKEGKCSVVVGRQQRG